MPTTVDGHSYPLLTDENNPPRYIQELASSIAEGNWTTYTPTLAGIAGSATASWSRIGKTVTVEFVITATGAATSAILIGKPVDSVTPDGVAIGKAMAVDGGAIATRRSLTVVSASTTTALFIVDSLATNATVTTAIPWTWAVNDTISGSFEYRAA